MTALPDWMVRSGEGLTVADYEALPEEVCRQIEIVDGAVVVSPSPRRAHQHIAHNLVTALKETAGPGYTAVGDVDLRLRDVPLLNRRPDVVVYDAALPDDEPLRPEHCLLVIEIMSEGSVTTDQIDKPGEYAASGIQHFWRVEYDDQVISVFRYQLDPTTRTYGLAGLDKGKLVIADPVELELDLETLR
ncbi:Uma2 family endonuclease [Actinophytocola sp. NPDC049390]|uniref:Uma2 family endonuclease n=1 Tax=Actinophytocola sp. NPDC049390 TaxID=3363894 RepID=UPI00379F78B6